MSKNLTDNTKFTTQVTVLLSKTYGRSPLKDSVVEQAIGFYEHAQVSQNKLDKITHDLALLKRFDTVKSREKLSNLERVQRDYLRELRFKRNERCQYLQQISREIIELCESESFDETNRKSAKFLGTIQLLAPTEGSHIATVNERSKPLYKAILALRLLDEVCLKQLLPDSYLAQELAEINNFDYRELRSESEASYQQFVDRVKVPLVMAAILQDIGNYHPDAQKLMYGVDGKKDNFRTLNVEERKSLLQINYRETLKYVHEGVGVALYSGNSKAEREVFNRVEANKLRFIKQLLKSSVQPKFGLGNLLKIPQIYSAIVLSTKENYNYKLLPKVYQALYQNAEDGRCSASIVDTLHKITGDFPQGYGVIFMPSDVDQEAKYEYAIVTQLYPKNPDEPICRLATRHLTFIGHGAEVVIKKSNNLYFAETAKAFSRLSKARLNEILALLSSNHLERQKLDLLPRFWHPGEYFSTQANQKLWNRVR